VLARVSNACETADDRGKLISQGRTSSRHTRARIGSDGVLALEGRSDVSGEEARSNPIVSSCGAGDGAWQSELARSGEREQLIAVEEVQADADDLPGADEADNPQGVGGVGVGLQVDLGQQFAWWIWPG
jgi:hypothetical protein